MPLNNPPTASVTVIAVVVLFLFGRDNDPMAYRQNLIVDYSFISFFGDPGPGKQEEEVARLSWSRIIIIIIVPSVFPLPSIYVSSVVLTLMILMIVFVDR